LDELEREVGGGVRVADGVARLARRGLVLRLDGGFVIASASGRYALAVNGRRRDGAERIGHNIRRIRRAADITHEACALDAEISRPSMTLYDFACIRAHCYLCHADKLIGDRRTREKRAWQREVDDQVAG
jgi:hypothetical protein